ncbi:hypothetical protein Bca4012_036039 [Brassica carinata]|uniref:Uncharacterized protein n=1 Tax=Brassica carinata TaxID=52824 RepID=A0A8X7WAK4_BRACI|nr:hypothetical protein Bca52824_009817 [Brassica carinata]
MISVFGSFVFFSLFERDNAKFCSCGGDRQVYYWDVSTGRVIRKFRGQHGEVNVTKFSDSSAVVVYLYQLVSIVRIWDCRSHRVEPVQVFAPFVLLTVPIL